MQIRVPAKLSAGDVIRVISPARSRAMVNEHDHSELIEARFAELGIRITYGEHVDDRDVFDSSEVQARVDDLHAAFADPEVAGVLTVIGGFNSNELLPYLDWDLIAASPKVFCGFSDITALQNAMLARAGLVTYSGPHWSSFGMRDHFEQTRAWFVQTLFGSDPVELRPSAQWTDDPWFLDQDVRTLVPGDGWWPLRPGAATGRVVGGNLCTLNLLQGTPFMPSLDGALLFVEDDFLSNPSLFARDLTSLLQQPDAVDVRGLVIGRFQRDSKVSREVLAEIVQRQPALYGKPVLANVDFGHTSPQATLPIGGEAAVRVASSDSTLTLTRH